MDLMAEPKSPFRKRVPIADPRRFRPKFIGDAREIIKDYYRKCRWDERSQLKWHEICGLEPKPLDKYTAEEIRKIIDRMEQGKMPIFRD